MQERQRLRAVAALDHHRRPRVGAVAGGGGVVAGRIVNTTGLTSVGAERSMAPSKWLLSLPPGASTAGGRSF